MLDPFHLVRVAGDVLDHWGAASSRDCTATGGRKDDLLNRARRTLHTGAGLLTDKQAERLITLFADQVSLTLGLRTTAGIGA